MMTLISLFVFIFAARTVYSANLLFGSHMMSVSHVMFMYDVAEELQKTNRHTITEARWPMMKPVADYPARKGFRSLLFNKTYEFTSTLDFLAAAIDDSGWKKDDGFADILGMLKAVWPMLSLLCEEVLEDEKINRNLTSEGYTLAILDPFSSPCAPVAMQVGKIPIVILSPLVEPSTIGSMAGIPVPNSYVMSLLVAKNDYEMNLLHRTTNVFGHAFFPAFMSSMSSALSWQFGTKHNTPGLFDGFGNTMIFVNSHRFLDLPHPTSLAKIDIGHRKLPVEGKISKDIFDFVEDEKSKGTIIFSMSTFTSSGSMPEEIMEMFANAFAKFPEYRFIWRINDIPSRLKAKNIHIAKWIPQTELLYHKKTALLITHGGQNSVMEALHAGVPMIGIPMMGDQHPNIDRIRARKLGLRLPKSELSEANIAQKIGELLNNQIYIKNAKKLVSMLETEKAFFGQADSTWWLEYAVRHIHQIKWLIPKGAELGCFVYFGFDVLGVLLLFAWFIS